jgi:membrane-associated protein
VLDQLPTLHQIISWGGYVGLFAIVFSETGLLVGFFLPGDSLLFTAGLFAAQSEIDPSLGVLDIRILVPLLCFAAISGNTSGYFIGHKAGQALYNRPQTRWFRQDHLLKTHEFYEKYGAITIVLAQFMPFARTFAPVVAGIAEMKYRRFIAFNIIGALSWISSMTLLGYFLGRAIPGIEKYLEVIIGGIIFLSVSPILVKYLKHRLATRRAQSAGSAAERDTPA